MAMHGIFSLLFGQFKFSFFIHLRKTSNFFVFILSSESDDNIKEGGHVGTEKLFLVRAFLFKVSEQ